MDGLLLGTAMPTEETARFGDHGVDGGWRLETRREQRLSGSCRRAASGEIQRKGIGGQGSPRPCGADGGGGGHGATGTTAGGVVRGLARGEAARKKKRKRKKRPRAL